MQDHGANLDLSVLRNCFNHRCQCHFAAVVPNQVLEQYRRLPVRGWTSPWGDKRVCSITGGAIQSIRVPNHRIGPCETPQEFHEYLLAPARYSFALEAMNE